MAQLSLLPYSQALSYLRNGIVEQFLVCFVEFPLVFVGETLVYGTILDVDIVDISVLPGIVVDDSKHVDIGDGVAYDLALCRKIIQCEDSLLVFLGASQTLIFRHIPSFLSADIAPRPSYFPSESRVPDVCFPDIRRTIAYRCREHRSCVYSIRGMV